MSHLFSVVSILERTAPMRNCFQIGNGSLHIADGRGSMIDRQFMQQAAAQFQDTDNRPTACWTITLDGVPA